MKKKVNGVWYDTKDLDFSGNPYHDVTLKVTNGLTEAIDVLYGQPIPTKDRMAHMTDAEAERLMDEVEGGHAWYQLENPHEQNVEVFSMQEKERLAKTLGNSEFIASLSEGERQHKMMEANVKLTDHNDVRLLSDIFINLETLLKGWEVMYLIQEHGYTRSDFVHYSGSRGKWVDTTDHNIRMTRSYKMKQGSLPKG